MQAIVQDWYGSPDALQLREVDKPAPSHNEVLMRVLASELHAADWHVMRGDPYLVRVRPSRRGRVEARIDQWCLRRDLVGNRSESGKVTPVIDRAYQLREVPEAIRYLGLELGWSTPARRSSPRCDGTGHVFTQTET